MPRRNEESGLKRDDQETAASLIPSNASLEQLKAVASGCKACHLWRDATQTVFGEGPKTAKIVLVGEQPGDEEDIHGRPFVGPAGKLLDRALNEAGIDRGQAYVTNVVKHFKYIPRGKRRIHDKPNAEEISACRPWLEAEIERVMPTVLVCLGATAAQALLGRDFRVSRQRGEPVDSRLAPNVLATVHPSSILRIKESDGRHKEMAQFVADLKKAGSLIKEGMNRVQSQG